MLLIIGIDFKKINSQVHGKVPKCKRDEAKLQMGIKEKNNDAVEWKSTSSGGNGKENRRVRQRKEYMQVLFWLQQRGKIFCEAGCNKCEALLDEGGGFVCFYKK
jgi:hypothetical protein